MAEALEDTRVVLVNGARQAGKSTLVRLVAADRGATYRSLDEGVIRQAAQEDPAGFVDVLAPLVIDEVQRVPELFLAIKADVDARPTPGRFLLATKSKSTPSSRTAADKPSASRSKPPRPYDRKTSAACTTSPNDSTTTSSSASCSTPAPTPSPSETACEPSP